MYFLITSTSQPQAPQRQTYLSQRPYQPPKVHERIETSLVRHQNKSHSKQGNLPLRIMTETFFTYSRLLLTLHT